jgi:hypothetical protein
MAYCQVYNQAAIELLGEVAEQLERHTRIRILLDGHSHVPGSPRSQLMELAEGRAKAVLAALKMLGIDESRMATCGSGNTGRGMKVYINIRSIDKFRPKDEPELSALDMSIKSIVARETITVKPAPSQRAADLGVPLTAWAT